MMGTMPGIGLESLPAVRCARLHPPCEWGGHQAPRPPEPQSSRPPWRATRAAKNDHRAGSLPRGRARGSACGMRLTLRRRPQHTEAQQMLTTVSGRHRTQLWAIVSPSGLAETSSELHRGLSLLLPASPSFPFSFQRRRPAHTLKPCLACPCSPPLSFTSISPTAPLTLGVCFPEDPTNTPSDLHLTMT